MEQDHENPNGLFIGVFWALVLEGAAAAAFFAFRHLWHVWGMR
jgi:hypothetical protein